jgi:hypothetical protein
MKEVLFALPGIALTIVCWGTYGSVLHRGQMHLGDRLKPLMCIGLAYFIFAIILPTVILSSMGKLGTGWNFKGVSWSTIAGAAGAFGSLGTIMAFSSGGRAIYVMPLVFGGAPIINVLVSMYFQGLRFRDLGARFPFFLAGVIMVAVGAAMVLVFAPKSPGHGGHAPAPNKSVASNTATAFPKPEPKPKPAPASDTAKTSTDSPNDSNVSERESL